MTSGDAEAPRTAVLISGSGTNLQAIIDAQASGELPITLATVISDQRSAYGLERATAAGIPTATVPFRDFDDRQVFNRELAAALDAARPELVVLAGFMRILPDFMVDKYHGRMMNIHPSLLPKYPGLDTYRRALAADETWHGSTVHFVTPELDSGPRIVQYRLRIEDGDDEASLAQRTQRGEYIIYPKAIRWFAEGRLDLRDGVPWLDDRQLAEPVVVEEQQ